MQLSQATLLANDLHTQLSSACVRLEIAGSVRRAKADVGDIELVAIPSTGEFIVPDLWGNPAQRVPVNHLEDALVTLVTGGQWTLARDPATQRPLRNGPAWKKLQHTATGLLCDLFITDRRRWGYTFTIRTGPGDFSKALVKLAHRRGKFFKGGLLHNHPPVFDASGEAQPCPSGEGCLRVIPTLDELDVFSALDLPYIEPADRTISALMIGARG